MFKEASLALEYTKVLDALGSHCLSEVSRAKVRELAPLPEAEEVRARAALIEEVRRLMQAGGGLGISTYEPIADTLAALRPEESILEPNELLSLKPALYAMTSAASSIEGFADSLPLTSEFTEGLLGFSEIVRRIESTIGPEAEILDSASLALSELRGQMRALDRKVSRRLEEITRTTEFEPFLQDTFVTKRSGRWVLPVRMDSKGMVSGVVHDVSRTGETAFMEPLEIIGLSNELENLSAEVRAEEIRILRAISAEIRAEAADIEGQFDILVRLDVLNAIAAFAEAHALHTPGINTDGVIKLDKALNPLLMLLDSVNVVPLDMALGEEARVMAITGPNAGGKTVTMKTVGLTILMALSGIPVPAGEGTSIPFVTGLLVDIGDEQSVEAHLSTFSAHATNIAKIIKSAGKGSIVLLDELGTGTDPSQGAALGAAVLQELSDKGALVLATTHLIDIVGYVHKSETMVNASMSFDEATMRPLYRLRKGEPGQSHAIETAATYGMPDSVVERAKELAGTIQVEFEGLVRDLQARRLQLEREEEAAAKEREALGLERRELKKKLKEADNEKKNIMRQAFEEARAIVRSVKREATGLLETVKRERKKSALKSLDTVGKVLDSQIDALTEKPEPIPMDELEPGMRVHVASIRLDAEVVSVDTKSERVKVNSSGKELEVPASSILEAKEAEKTPQVRTHLVERATEASSEIKLIGLRVDEALERLEPFLNSASLSGLDFVRVIHGLGTGALRGAVREFLEEHPLVESFRPGDIHEGGDGATVATLR
ncbi:MAG: endonuclease MutS2 [Thermodesulfovibrionales bacterium]|nr:endonuclease MutS2 [Thermodesulfovibrionales bacterium]